MPLPLELIVYMTLFGAWAVMAPVADPDGFHALTVMAGAGAVAGLWGVLLARLARSRGDSLWARWSRWVDTLARIGVALFAFGAVALSGWPLAWVRPDANGAGFFLTCLAGLLLYLWVFFCIWWPLYSHHVRTRPGCWSRWSYLIHQARYSLYLLPLWLAFLAVAEFVPVNAPMLLLLGALAAWTAPWMILKLWGCRSVDSMPWLRLRVENLQRRAGIGFSRVYLWDPGGGRVLNAAAVGMVRPFRYLIVTPELARQLPPEELDAVIAHELGHVRHWHLALYLMTAFGFLSLAWKLTQASGLFSGVEQVGLEVVSLLLFWRYVFGWMSRRLERQADLYALELLGRPEPLVNALERLAMLMPGGRRARSWHHGDIVGRVAFLRAAAAEPSLGRNHHVVVGRLRWLATFLLVTQLFGWFLAAGFGAGDATRPAAASTGAWTAARHWSRVARVLPDDPSGPLALARAAWRSGSEADRRRALAQLAAARGRARTPAEAEALDRVAEDWKTLAGVAP